MFSKLKNYVLEYLFVRLEAFRHKKMLSKKQTLLTQFKKVGSNFSVGKDYKIINPKHIEIGDNFSALDRFRIEAWDAYEEKYFEPKITIGNNVIFNTDIHIGCINAITIGDNCLFGSRIYITDHNHGDTSDGMIALAPLKRPLISKGAVRIENNVWIGEGVAIMPGVTIGENSIIATNAVVTKNIPPNAVAAGIPAKVIKYIK